MNNELKQALTAFFTKSLDLVEKGVSVAGEQIPLVLQEIVKWEFVRNGIGAIFGFCLLLAVVWVARHAHRNADKEGKILCWGWGTAFALVSFVIFLIPLGECIKALVAPRLVIIEYLKGML